MGSSRVLPVLIICLLQLAMTMQAEAAAFEYVSSSTGVAANTSDDVAVPCPNSTRAVGGGVYLSGSTLETEVRSSAPYDSQGGDRHPDDGWAGIGNAGPGPETITAYGICSRRGSVRYAVASKVVGASERGRTRASCPDGWQAIGGGVQTARGNASTEIRMVGSIAIGVGDGNKRNDAWRGIVDNGSTAPVKMKTWATCASGVELRVASSFNGVPVFLDGTQDEMETLACSTGRFRLTGGGGVVIGAPSGSEIATFEPRDTGDADSIRDDAWKAWFNNQSGSDQRMSVQAICAKFKR